MIRPYGSFCQAHLHYLHLDLGAIGTHIMKIINPTARCIGRLLVKHVTTYIIVAVIVPAFSPIQSPGLNMLLDLNLAHITDGLGCWRIDNFLFQGLPSFIRVTIFLD